MPPLNFPDHVTSFVQQRCGREFVQLFQKSNGAWLFSASARPFFLRTFAFDAGAVVAARVLINAVPAAIGNCICGVLAAEVDGGCAVGCSQVPGFGTMARRIWSQRSRRVASVGHRGRDAPHGTPPAQIPAGVIDAPGSHLG